MLNPTDDRIDDSFTLLSKTGDVVRGHRLAALSPLADHLYEAFEDEVLFDIYYSGDTLKSLSYTEIFSQGLMISPCHDKLRYRLAEMALEDDDAPVTADMILSGERLDKYRLLPGFETHELDVVVFLPGTNIIDMYVDFERLRELVYNENAIVKPHPISSAGLMHRLESMFPGRVASRRESGYDMLCRAKRVCVTTNSEMGLMAILMNKDVEVIDRSNAQRPIYKQIYDAVMHQSDRKIALEKVLGSRHAGFYWTWQDKGRAEQIVTAIRNAANA
ncbi:hypothetical protein [Vreelandella sulfidaeris]|uniref:Uncharacterized protein n=1 Tax=Vreelandella sulfidaeris TaxID=115553 RepID=A0A455UBF7_9GAMM|nr:hypothetical protein HSBAA_29440 [Halomonas sulfidaeris]